MLLGGDVCRADYFDGGIDKEEDEDLPAARLGRINQGEGRDSMLVDLGAGG